MKITRTNQTGASHIFALLAVTVVLVIGAIGYKVTSMSKTPTDNAKTATTTTTTEPMALKSKGDVVKANKDLDSVPVDADLDPAQLDTDISNLQ